MRPQSLDRKSHTRRWICLGALAALAGWLMPGGSRAQMPIPPVNVSPVVEQTVSSGHTFVGTVMPLRSSTVGSPIDGRVMDFFVNEGEAVKAGQPMAQLRTKTIELELAAAQAELKLRQEELRELQNGARPEELDQAEARLKSLEPIRDKAQSKYERTQSLFDRNAVSSEELEDMAADAEQALQAVIEAKAALAMMKAGPREEEIAQAAARVDSQQEVVARLADILDKHTIVAPFDGYVIAEHTEVGQWLMQGAPVADVVDLSQVDIEVLVLEDYIRYVTVGTPARIEMGALHDMTPTGHVALIVPQADVRSRSFPVKVRVDNIFEGDNMLFKAGMFARVTLPVGEQEAALLVPKDAIVLGGPTPMVHVVDRASEQAATGKTRPVPVQLGVASDELIQIRGQLKAGDVVVTQGNERLMPQQEVQIVKTVPIRSRLTLGRATRASGEPSDPPATGKPESP